MTAMTEVPEYVDLEQVASEVLACATSWEKDVRLLGNARAGDIALLMVDYLILRQAALEAGR